MGRCGSGPTASMECPDLADAGPGAAVGRAMAGYVSPVDVRSDCSGPKACYNPWPWLGRPGQEATRSRDPAIPANDKE